MSTNKINITDEQKQQATDAIKDGLKDGIEATKNKNLTWWERALWIAALVAASLVQTFFGTSCTMNLTKLPDGTLSFSVGERPAPVVVKEGK